MLLHIGGSKSYDEGMEKGRSEERGNDLVYHSRLHCSSIFKLNVYLISWATEIF